MFSLTGKIDSSNVAEWEKKLLAEKPTEIDASQLTYVSSAGLRALLRLRQEVGGVSVFNVSPYVYEIFDVTGFTQLFNIEKIK